jgi:hypothetical protein
MSDMTNLIRRNHGNDPQRRNDTGICRSMNRDRATPASKLLSLFRAPADELTTYNLRGPSQISYPGALSLFARKKTALFRWHGFVLSGRSGDWSCISRPRLLTIPNICFVSDYIALTDVYNMSTIIQRDAFRTSDGRYFTMRPLHQTSATGH